MPSVIPEKRSTPSIVSIFLIVLFFITSFFYFNKWKNNSLIGGDPLGYYMYLPAAFIYHDIENLRTSQAIAGTYRPELYKEQQMVAGIGLDNGNFIIKYSMGIAIMNLPFFMLAHPICMIAGYPTDGFSLPFQLMIYAGSLFYVICGLLFLRAVLKSYFTDTTTAAVLIILAAGTNLYCYAIYESAMAHSYLFFLYAALLYCTIRWYENQKMLFAVSIGMCCGLITLSRPNEIICILIPLLYGVGSFAGLTERFKFIKQQTKGFLLAVSVFIAVGIPQIIYWKALSGKFLFYSYGNEGFDFLHTHLLSGLFSFQNGWLIYTPIMIFAIGGIFLLPRKNGFKIPILLFIPVYVFMIYSYWAWNYFNGFGSRPMVEAYPLLSIPLGYMLQWLFDNAQRKVLSFAVLGFLLLLNIFQLWQYDRGILQTSIVNSTTYLNVFGRTILTPNAVISYDINQFQPENLSLVKTVCTLNFNDSLNLLYKKQSAANYFYLKNSAVEFFNLVELNGQDLKLEEGDFLKITLRAKNEELFDRLKMTSVVAQVNKNKKEVFWKGLLIQNKSNLYNATHVRHNPQDWYTVAYFLCIPPDIMFDSKLNFYLWDPCRCNMLAIDDFTIEIWK